MGGSENDKAYSAMKLYPLRVERRIFGFVARLGRKVGRARHWHWIEDRLRIEGSFCGNCREKSS